MNIISGIYKIVNIKNGKMYIGSSKNIKRRWGIHKSSLKNNRHHSVYLQRAWNKYGKENFVYEVIKEMPNTSDIELFNEETNYITTLKPDYNVGGVGGGDNLTNNPNRELIIEKITLAVHTRNARMTEQDKLEKWSRPGEKNPNWKGGLTFCECGNRISSTANCCASCFDKSGINNPFYGKHHTYQTKEKLRRINKGRLPPNTNPIVLDGVSYISQADAARKLGVSIGTISNWVTGKFKRRPTS
jgi:hypothetical protein